jgi:AraC-like DNA-binding protein
MEALEMNVLLNLFPHFTHVVERICTPGWQIKPGNFYDHNLILIYAGEALFHCNGRDFRGYRGNLIYYRPGDYRFANTFPENLMKCFAVDFRYTCPVFKDGDWVNLQPDLPFQTLEKIADPYLLNRLLDLFGNFIRQWMAGTPSQQLRCRATFSEIIHLLITWKTGGDINFDKIKKVERVIGYMAEHYPRRLTLKDLGEVIQVSPSYLGAIFKEVTGISPIEYLLTIRMNKAKDLIRDGYSIAEAAQNTGFNDIYYFSKYFKKAEGISPSQYRKQQQNLC